MNIQRAALLLLICGVLDPTAPTARAQSIEGANATGVTNTSTADGTRGPNNGSPALTGARHPLYRLRKSDIVEIKFTFSPEFDQSATVLPDGFLALKTVGDVFAEGLTVAPKERLPQPRKIGKPTDKARMIGSACPNWAIPAETPTSRDSNLKAVS